MFGLGVNRLGVNRTGRQLFNPVKLFLSDEEGTFLDFTTSQVYADTAGTDPAEVGEGIAFVDDKSPNDTDATQATSTARPIFARVPVGGRRNLLERTEEFDNAYWFKFGGTVSGGANATESPDGGSALRFTVLDTGATNTAGVAKTSITLPSLAPVIFSIFAKAGSHDSISLRNDIFDTAETWFDLSTGTVGTTTGGQTGAIASVGNGWYRCSVIFTPAVLTGNVVAKITATNGTGSIFYNGTDFVYFWGAQLEVAA